MSMDAGSRIVWIGELSDTYIGDVWMAKTPAGLVAVDLWGNRARFIEQLVSLTGTQPAYTPQRLSRETSQLQEYLNGDRQQFELKIEWSFLTPFQQEVLRIVSDIEYGRTRTYGEIANQLGKPQAMRAVGRANATNPMPIIIPCHRVLGSDGRLHGYSAPGGIETKARLLRLEGSWLI